MAETLFHAYLPLVLWTSVGLLLFRFIPEKFPHLLGRGLYWVGVPVQILALARQSNLSEPVGMAPAITVGELLLGLGVASLSWWGWQRIVSPQSPPGQDTARQGSFILASVLGNTGFVGLAIAPYLVDHDYLSWIVFFSLTHNLVGPFGFGVLIASHFGRAEREHHWWIPLRDVVSVPSLWAFILGSLTQSVPIPQALESGLQASVGVVIACAFLLIGMRLFQLQGWKSWHLGLIPAVLRVVIIPALVGLTITIVLGLSGDRRLAMVLMSGMPSAFVGLILAEEYNLDRELIVSSIVVSTILLLLVLPVWIVLLGH